MTSVGLRQFSGMFPEARSRAAKGWDGGTPESAADPNLGYRQQTRQSEGFGQVDVEESVRRGSASAAALSSSPEGCGVRVELRHYKRKGTWQDRMRALEGSL